MKLGTLGPRYRLPADVLLTVGFLAFAVRSARLPGEPAHLRDFLLVLGVFGVPFVVLVFIVLASRWNEMGADTPGPKLRNRIALAGAIMGALSSVLLVLLLPFWSFMVAHGVLAEVWVGAGAIMSIFATVCGLFGSRILRRPAITSVLLLPFWFIVAALLVKGAMD